MTLEELAGRAAEKGFWMSYESPIRSGVGNCHSIGFWPHGTTSGGIPVAEVAAVTLLECIKMAARVLEGEAGSLHGPQHKARMT